jgi:hypothetical protein
VKRALAAAGCAAVLAACPASAAFAQQTPYAPPRTADGKPDLGGVWSNADEPYAVVDPPDGELPLRDRASALAWRQKYATYMTGAPLPAFTVGPDTLPLRDRCLMAANAAAPPMSSQGYNDAYQFVQTPAYVVISVEMMNETRIVPVVANAAAASSAHRPRAVSRWTGDSVGWWEGDTFVVETINIDARQRQQSPTPMSADAVIVERFTRTGADELSYQTEVTDPALYARPWRIASSFHRIRRVWEYACHEGNYDVAGILATARRADRRRGGQ